MLARIEDALPGAWGKQFLERSRQFDALTTGERTQIFAEQLRTAGIDLSAVRGEDRMHHYWAQRTVYTYKAAVDLVSAYRPTLAAAAAVIIAERVAEKADRIVRGAKFGKILSIYQ